MPMPRSYAWLKEGETCRFCIGSGAALGGKCKHCGGLGKTFGGGAREACPVCDGQSKSKEGVPCTNCDAKGWLDFEAKQTIACRYCMGSGNTVGGTCKHCGGQGRMELDAEGKPVDVEKAMAAREQKCPMCLGIGYRARGTQCDTCGGSGKVIGPPPKSAPKPASPAATPGGKAPPEIVRPEISQGNPLAQSKLGATRFCMGCGSGIPPGRDACPKCGKPVNAPTVVQAVKAGMPAAAAATPAPSPAAAMFKPPNYCRACGTAFKFEIKVCPKCGKAVPAAPPA